MSFPLAGNEKARRAIGAFISSGKLPHAIILCGEAGLGKHTLAAYIAKAAVCSGSEKPCGTCRDCLIAADGNHPDVIYVRREKDKKGMGVEVIRSLRADAFIKPHEADKKVFIIEEAEKMNQNAQNALLKILEEPPASVMFILLCESASALLPTVRSRCIAVTLSPVGTEEGISAVTALAKCDQETARAALESARGNVGRAAGFAAKKEEDPARAAAAQFIEYLLARDEYGMLKTLAPFEKDRAATDGLFRELKTEVWEKIKTLPKNGKRAAILFRFYEDLNEFSENADLNANLPLLFCALTARAAG